MLRVTHASPGRIDVAQGTIVEHCCQFYSDKDLRGRKIAVDLGLFLSAPNELGKLSPAWQLVYPITGSGSTFMNLVGTTQQWQNFEVILTALDSQSFVIQLKFVQLADVNSYLGNTPFDSYTYFTGASVAGGTNIYDAVKFLSVKVTVQHPGNLDVGVCDTEWSAIRWCEEPDNLLYTDYFTTNIKNVNGWVSGKDLTVRFLTSSQNPINSTWFGGIIRANSGNTGTWWDDIRLQYGTFSQFVSQVNTTFDYTALTDSRSLKGDTYGNYEGLFVVDSSYFIAGESYQAFFIWEEVIDGVGVLKSCLSNVFGEEVDPDSPVLVFDSENTITLNDNSDIGTLNETCLHNLSPCQDVTVCTTIDAVSFDAALTAAGLPYTLDQLISGTLTGIQAEFFAYGAEFLQVNSPPIFSNFTYPLSSYTPNVSWTLCAQFTVPESWQGETRYVFLMVKLALPGGGFYEILFPFTFSVVEYGTVLEPTETPKQFYCDDTEDIEFCFETFDNTFNFIAKVQGVEAADLEYVESIDPDFTGGDACLTIDYTKVSFNQDICFCLVAQKNTVNQISPADCDCGNITFTFDYANGINLYVCDIDLTDIIPIATGSVVNVTSTLFTGQQTFNDQNLIEVIFVAPRRLNETLQVELITPEGCVYIIEVDVPLDQSFFGVEVCLSNTKIISIPCDKDPSLDVFCSGSFYEANLVTDGATIDFYEYTFDFNTWTPYTVPVALADGEEIFIKALLTYTEVECGTFELWGSLKASACQNCYEGLPPINSCPDYLNVSHSWLEIDELLTINAELLLWVFGEASACDGASDSDLGVQYSFDGLTYFDYVAPIDTTGYNIVYYQWNTVCNGCADTTVGMWERGCCGGSGTAVVVGICEAMALMPYGGPMTPNTYILTQDPETLECQLVSFEICEFLNALLEGEPTTTLATKFIYIDIDGNCKKGSIDICNWVENLTTPDPLPADLSGLDFIFQEPGVGCFKIDISSYISGGSDQAAIQWKDEGVNLGAAGTVDTVDLVGAGVTATRVLNVVTITVPDWQDKVQYQDEGVNLGALGTVDTIDFVGSGVTATRVGDVVTVTIPGNVDEQDQIQFQNEGVNLGTAGTVTEYDHVGPNVTATRSVNKVTVTYSAWQALLQWYYNGVALGTSGTVTDFNTIGTFGEMSRISNATTLDLGPYERYETTNTSHVATKLIWFYYMDCTAGNLIFDLPAAAGNGSLIYVKKIDSTANTLQIRPDGTDLINGVNTSYYLTGYNEGVVIKSDLDGLTDWQFVATNLTNHTGEIIGQRNLTAHKTLISNRTAVTAVGTDYVLIGDTSDSDNLKKALVSDFGNVTHTGEVTGATVLTVDKTAISNKTLVTAAKDDHILVGDASDSDNLKKVKVQTIRTYVDKGTNVGDGVTVLTAGFAGYFQVKFPTATATLIGVTLLADASGSVVFDIEKSTFAGFPTTASIVGANLPELSGAQKAQITLDGAWTTSVASGDCFKLEITGTPATIKYVNLTMYFELEV